ncbi:uncharacterized protein LY89DRAFT_603447 [Mollisia scopiformis]|uniref:Uncharacterized protein n=1 Tax=Mollisia scopiformis TaxID=149040 RepID=A0A132B1T9_MOLSC|nr:uncharacterized protein LY89DRAFT_603447 [Mollisia scopiformis]KUJ06346.1 hypothetical protein LY89DRAFT_603447 [Mollisia scopiformis]
MNQPAHFDPFLADVFEVKNDLCKGLKLPMELIDSIVDFAEYWPHTTTVRRGEKIVTTGRGHEEDFVLRSYPLGYLPTKSDETDCSMLDKTSFPTIDPLPWSTTKPVAEGSANEEVKGKWLEESHMKSDHPCRKIVFTIKSHDQGWGGDRQHRGTYQGSYTWFDVGKEELIAFKEGQEPSSLPSKPSHKIDLSSDDSASDAQAITSVFHTISPRTESNQTSSDDTNIQYHFHHEFIPNQDCLQKNLTATKNVQTHQVVWSCDDDTDPDSVFGQALEDRGRGRATATGEFVRNMKIGDVVTVWAKARFAEWANTIEEVKIDVYWAV